MNAKIERLTAALHKAQRLHGKRIAEIKAALQEEWNKAFDADKDLQSAITELESSNNWISGEEGIERYVRWHDLATYADCREFLEAYLSEQAIYLEEEALTTSEGPSLIINDDGDVYDQDSRKTVVRRADYLDDEGEEDESKRNALIEAWMEKSGYFPGVFRQDRHGNVFHVNTTVKAGV